ncbi:MAG: hypothetical protein JWO22_665 [Frankiales bacterium]|nr:hypothetical protein [Frankiales bacterium]
MCRMGLMDKLNQLDERAGVAIYVRPEPDPARRRARLERMLRMWVLGRYTPPIVPQELLYLRDRVDALEAQVQSLTSTDGA